MRVAPGAAILRTVIKTSLSEDDSRKLQEALTPTEPVGAS